ncbi:MAG TPA: FtsX-like permease family protein [Syntrophorhabdaceae bacterium]|nr:FtsX-like permease family protein [Syntrophorhabdaceae bacterium]HOL05782.1 FtsX-like permease family protein [Syntrophorhabdaceae bacterium]HPP41476.1 FtsX-like permease family protein [Syntrophorhabdaceae bacterium]
MKIVIKAFLRYLLRRRSLSILQLLGIACGVAAVIGMAISARSALYSFNEAIEFLRGKATHHIEKPAGSMDEDILIEIINDPAVDFFSPVIDRRIRIADGEVVRLLGIDPFLDSNIRPEIVRTISRDRYSQENNVLYDFIYMENAVLIDGSMAKKLGLSPKDTINTNKGIFNVVGTFSNPSGELLIIMDIGNAQKVFELKGMIDRIDLILNDDTGFRGRWGQGFKIESNRQRRENLTALLQAFKLNLQALSLLALFVGVFLIYNTAMFAVVSRRKDAGIMRGIGVRRSEVFLAFTTEIILFGIAGGAIGSIFGYILSRILTDILGSTISNLYFFLRPTPLAWSWWNMLAGIVLGCGASLLGGITPMIDLVKTEPVSALRGRIYQKASRKTVKKLSVYGLLIILMGIVFLFFTSAHVYIGFAGTFIFLIGISLTTGFVLMVSIPLLRRFFSYLSGTIGKIAISNIWLNTNRTSIAVAAFMIALSMAIGLGSLIHSFRHSLIWWMNSQLRGDIYISTRSDVDVPLELYEELKKIPGIGGIDIYRNIQITYRGKPVHITAIDSSVLKKYTQFSWLKGGSENWDPVKKGSVIVSESFARRFRIKEGDTVSIESARGMVSLPVTGIFHDYSTEHGVIMMDRSTYINLFNDRTINSLGIFIDVKGEKRQGIIEQVEKMAYARGLPTSRQRQFHERILGVFDNTFAITRSMRTLATIVAFFGIAGALMTLFVERQQEFGIYRALGFSTGQVALITLMEGIGMGLISFLMSIFTGSAIAYILIKVINLESFNWTIFFYFSLNPYLAAFTTAILASIGASLYPLWKVYRLYPQMQIREE